jgi:hypothetical protein
MPQDKLERNREAMRKWRRNHPEEHRAEVITHYGCDPPKCACCGESNIKFLTIDHINNDGNEMRKIHGVGYKFLKWLEKMNYPDGFQILCMNCNWGKSQNNGVCPHVKK